MSSAIHVLIVEDHPMYRDAVSQALGRLESGAEHGLRCSIAAGSDQAVELLSWNPDIGLVLSDYRLAQGDGLELLQTVGRRWPTVARVLMSGSGDPSLCDQARRLGLAGYIPKSLEPQAFVKAIDRVLGGDTSYPPDEAGDETAQGLLTERQAAVLACVAAGQSNKVVARTLGISERTIKYHLEGAFLRLGVANRAEAVVSALAKGLIKPPQ